MTPSFAYNSLDESDNLLWMSKNTSVIRMASNQIKRKGSFDSFCEMIKSSTPGIELVLQKNPDVFKEFEEEKKEEGFRNSELMSKDQFFKDDNTEIDRSPSILLDISDNIYRKGKVCFYSNFPLICF